MTIATREEPGTKNLHTRYSAYLEVPATISATGAATLIHYVEIVVAYRHPELHLLRLAPHASGEVIHTPANFCRYLLHMDISTRADTRPDLLDAIIVAAGQALTAHCKPADGRRPGVGLTRAESSLLTEPGCPWCK
jgi:hypothetical protein